MTDRTSDRITENRPRSTDVGYRSVPPRNYNYRTTTTEHPYFCSVHGSRKSTREAAE